MKSTMKTARHEGVGRWRLVAICSAVLFVSLSVPAFAQTTSTPLIFGNTYISTGANAGIDGDILANAYLVVGATSNITGRIQTGTAVTTGATSDITGTIKADAAITLGASTKVDGDVCHGAALTLGAGAVVNGDDDCNNVPAMTFANTDVIAAQDSYNALTAADVVNRNQLNPQMPADLTLNPMDGLTSLTSVSTGGPTGMTVVYNATSLTTTAGITLTLDGTYDWVFNITDMLSFGAGTKVVLTDGSDGSITWNVGGYASIGEGAEILGTIFANGYISTGLGAKVTGAGSPSVSVEPSQSYCGGLLSATSYVTIGASGTVDHCGDDEPLGNNTPPVALNGPEGFAPMFDTDSPRDGFDELTNGTVLAKDAEVGDVLSFRLIPYEENLAVTVTSLRLDPTTGQWSVICQGDSRAYDAFQWVANDGQVDSNVATQYFACSS
jgi:hypothetical protein